MYVWCVFIVLYVRVFAVLVSCVCVYHCVCDIMLCVSVDSCIMLCNVFCVFVVCTCVVCPRVCFCCVHVCHCDSVVYHLFDTESVS